MQNELGEDGPRRERERGSEKHRLIIVDDCLLFRAPERFREGRIRRRDQAKLKHSHDMRHTGKVQWALEGQVGAPHSRVSQTWCQGWLRQLLGKIEVIWRGLPFHMLNAHMAQTSTAAASAPVERAPGPPLSMGRDIEATDDIIDSLSSSNDLGFVVD